MAPNRFLAQPMEGNDGENGGKASERTVNRYGALGKGHWGVAVVEAVSVVPDCLARVNQLILEENNLDSFKRLVAAYKEANPEGLLLIQITHSGIKGGAGTVPCVLNEPIPSGARLLSTAELEDIRLRFIKTARLAELAGADGIDFKFCHGYLGAEMLRPTNLRSDGWGSTFEGRTRLLHECVSEIRAASKASFLIGSRISVYEGIRGGCGTAAPDELVEDLAEMKKVIELMAELEMDYINVSAGIPGETSEITRPVPAARWFYLEHIRYAKFVMETLRAYKRSSAQTIGAVPLPTVIQSAFSLLKADALSLAADCIAKGYSDFAGFGRQQFADPATPAKLFAGQEPQWCAACSGCSRLMVKQVNDGCSLYNSYYKGLLSAGSGA
ncbi:NADH:flavin oxidoreductase [Treponema sp.]